jgi:Rrf2 family transcriptional regulator, iron-sulfur cluster assembly transcription factor
MIGSSATEYAIRALTHVAEAGGERVKVRDISDAEDIPAPFLSNVLNRLVAAGLVRSLRGPTGGYELARPPEEIRLLDIRAAIDGNRDLEECAVGLPHCSDVSPCPVHERWGPVRAQIRSFLTATTVADLVTAREGKPGRTGRAIRPRSR